MPALSASQQQFIDERFRAKVNALDLFLQISNSNVFSARFNENTSEYVGFEKFNFTTESTWNKVISGLEGIILNSNYKEFKTISVAVSNQLFTLVPSALFDEKELSTYLKFNHLIEDESQFRYYFNKIEAFQAVVIYAIPRALDFMLQAKLPPLQLNHFSIPLLEAINIQVWRKQDLLVHIQNNQFEVIYAPNKKLTFFNSFSYQSTEDFIYFLLYVMEQLQLDRETVNLNLWGEFEEKSAIYEMLYKYIRSITIGERPKDVQFSAVLSELPKQYHFSLFNQHLCG